jgi:hypothetical protein
MIAMANPFADYMTVKDVMAAINARSHSTVLLLLYDENKTDTAPRGKPLPAVKIPGLGWMVRRAAVQSFIAQEARQGRGVGFPRGRTRAEPAPPAPAKPRRAAKKVARARRQG